jgi:tetratricopeptide (TPR) repeat protein
MFSSWARRLAGAALVAAMAAAIPLFAQTGGVRGKCTGEDGKALVGYTVLIESQELKWTGKVKTDKNGEYKHIGISPAVYKFTLIDPDGHNVWSLTQKTEYGDWTDVNFDMAKERAIQKKSLEANPEYQKKMEEQAKEQKQFSGLKQAFDVGQALYDQKKYAEAAAKFEQALPLAKEKNAQTVIARLADTYSRAASVETDRDARSRDEQKSLEYFQKAMDATPNDASLHNNRGTLYANMGKTAEAQAEFQKAAELDPTRAGTYYYNLGVILVNKGKMDEAGQALKKCIDVDPKNANGWYWYGMALLGKANYQADGTIVPVPGTVEAFQTYLKLAPQGEWAPSAQGALETLKGKVPTEYKTEKEKKKKGS